MNSRRASRCRWWWLGLVLVSACLLPRGHVDIEPFRLCASAGGGLNVCDRSGAPGIKLGLASCSNAVMRVTAFRNGRRIKQWTGEVRWTGTLPEGGVYTGAVERGRVTWDGAAPEGVRVETDSRGNGGVPLRRWLPRTADRVEVRVDPGYGVGSGAGRGRPGASATAGSRAGPGGSSGESGVARGDAAQPRGGGRPGAGHGAGARAGHGAGRGAGGGAGQGAGDPCGLRGGGASGQRGGAAAEDGGVPDAWSPTPWGEAYGDPEGAAGGDGAHGEHGIRGAIALFALLEISRELRALVELVVIAADVTHPEEFVKRVATRLGRRAARGSAAKLAAEIRVEMAREATRFVKSEEKRLLPRFKAEWRGIPPEEFERGLLKFRNDKQLQYFIEVEKAARLDPAGNAIVLRAAKVKPVAGRLPRNHEYAGERFVVDARKSADAARIVRERRRRGVKFTDEGYPVFDPWVYKQGRIKADVRITNTRSKPTDFTAADKAMRLKLRDPGWRRPKGWTWHHTEDVADTSRMILVPKELHVAVPHTGGVAHYKHRYGDYNAY